MWSVKSGDTPGVFHSLSHPHKRKGAGRNRGGYTVTALRFPALLGRQSRRGLEIGSLSRPLAALRRFPPQGEALGKAPLEGSCQRS